MNNHRINDADSKNDLRHKNQNTHKTKHKEISHQRHCSTAHTQRSGQGNRQRTETRNIGPAWYTGQGLDSQSNDEEVKLRQIKTHL